MKSSIAIMSITALAAALPDPQVTPRAQLGIRQVQADPALLGYISQSGASRFSDARSCDYPATLSSSGSLAQCCSGSNCVFWSACSAGTLFAQSTSLRCDQGFCNTAVLVATPGATSGERYLGCWATSLGQSAFTIVRDVVIATAKTASSSAASASATASSARSTSARSVSTVASSDTVGTATQSSTGTAQSSGVAVANAAKPLTSAFGLIAIFFGVL